MGFLTGAYGKIMAGKYLRDLQYKQTLVNRQVLRASREVANMEKYLTRMEKQVNANMQYQMQYIMNPYMQAIGNPLMGSGQLNDSETAAWQNYTVMQQYMQQRMAMAQSLWAGQFEMIRESMLMPLKDKEDALQTELDSLKSQIQIAQQQYDAHVEEEKGGVKYLKPDYTGQG